MSTNELPDQFLYSRKGPWPQPSPSHPMKCAAEVLNIPPMEALAFNSTIGKRYLETQMAYPPIAGKYAAENAGWTGPTQERFNEIMFDTLYTRYLSPLCDKQIAEFKARLEADKPAVSFDENSSYGVYDFSAMLLVDPLPHMHVAGVKMIYQEHPKKNPTDITQRTPVQIVVEHKDGSKVAVYPEDSAWGLAQLYVMQGAAYHVLFVVHPALHFPFDSVNAITKSSVPMAHPLYQMLFPHTSYSLALDNAVLESAESVVNNNAQGTRFDPLTGNAYNLKLLFGAGYTGLPEAEYGNAYPPFDYLKPQMDFDSEYGNWLKDYYDNAFLPFGQAVAGYLSANAHYMDYVSRWANYNSLNVLGFPNGEDVKDADILGQTLAIYLWDTTVSHGGDHDSFGNFIETVEKCLRIRRAPPRSRDEPEVKVGEIFNGDDMARAAIANEMFFRPTAIPPNLSQTYYAFTQPELWAAAVKFHKDLEQVAGRWTDPKFMPLDAGKEDAPGYAETYRRTLPQSIQY